MKKICAVIGVESKKSLNFFALECFLQKWQEKEDILCNIIMLKNNTLEYCDECGHCVIHKRCYKENNDLLKKYIDEIERSDILIISTPVYANNLSARLLNFVNRSRYLAETQQLSKKSGIILITTNATGADFVKWYLSSLFNVLGINLINTITLYDSEILDQNILEKKISETINEVVNSRYQ